MWKKEMRASFTVEAVFVVPFCIFVLISLIYVAFYLHDLCVIKAYTDVCVEQVSNGLHPEEPLAEASDSGSWLVDQLVMHTLIITEKEEQEITRQVCSQLEGRLYISEVTAVEAEILLEHITMTTTADVQIDVPLVSQFFFKESMVIASEGRIYHPVEGLRVDYSIYAELKKTAVYEKIQEILEKVRGYL